MLVVQVKMPLSSSIPFLSKYLYQLLSTPPSSEPGRHLRTNLFRMPRAVLKSGDLKIRRLRTTLPQVGLCPPNLLIGRGALSDTATSLPTRSIPF